MGAIPTTMGGSRGAQAQEGSVTVSGVGLTQYLASAQHHGRQRRGTGPPSRAELSPAPLASVPASHVLSARWDLGTWGRRGGGVRVRHGTPQFIPPVGSQFGAHRYLHFLDHFAKGPEEIPSQVPAEPPCGDTSISWDIMCPPSYRATPQGRDPKDASTHQCCLRLSQKTHGSPSPSHGGPKFGTHHKKPPQW